MQLKINIQYIKSEAEKYRNNFEIHCMRYTYIITKISVNIIV